jgi:hypothetical protein
MKNNCYKRMVVAAFSVFVLALAAAAGPAGDADSRPAAPEDPWARYQLILDRNIFSRQRGPIRRPGEERETPVVVPNPESHFVLKGIVQENDEFIAFIEDTQAGTVLRLRKDERVARGTIKSLSLDGIEYQLEANTSTIKLGYDLEGRLGPVTAAPRPAAIAPTAPAPAGTATPPAGQPSAPAGDEAEILQRLMEQRKQQLGQ